MSFNYKDMMKQAKMMQKQMQEVQEQLKNMEFEASSGGGAVKVKVNGDQEVLEIIIDEEMAKDSDAEMMQDMILVAINDALKRSKEEAKDKLSSITGGLNIPGF